VNDESGKLPPESPIEAEGGLISLEDFFALGNRLISQNLFEEAVSLYRTAAKIFPNSLAVKLNLGRVQELQRKSSKEREKSIQQDLSRIRERDDLLASHYLSLATLYYARGQMLNAVELLELSKVKNENLSKTRYLLGKIFYDQGDLNRAVEELNRARELDPFYEDTYKHLGIIHYEKRQFGDAIQAFVDAYILSGGTDVPRTSYYQRQIRTLQNEITAEERKRYNQIFAERKEYFVNLSNALSVKKDTFESAVLEHVFTKLREMERTHISSVNLAMDLKKFPVIQGLTDDESLAIARISHQRTVKENEIIFREDDLTEGIYLINAGSVRIVKTTPFGEQLLSYLNPGSFFGEMDFIDSMRCSADAIANEDTVLFSLSKIKLEEMFLTRRHVAVQFYRQFWKTLSDRIRSANELLKSFFNESAEEENSKKEAQGTAGESTRVDLEKKMALLHEKGLSSKELRLLATFSSEEMYKAGQKIFVEGEQGDKLYIILDGEVRISKFIPGVGEEALAILERGDFFGEMALIDNAPRSADAISHTDVTVLPLQSRLLTEILSRDVDSSYQFLYILCKILSRRLREINLKIYQWRMMAGNF
jgi:CRP-like cAMP-binding protein/cytochrome c-type biogenesis protein CcmH/NrfG